MLTFPDSDNSRSAHLSDEDLVWLRQLESVFPTRPLVPMRITERLGKLGFIELRAQRLMITGKGLQYLRHAAPPH